MKVNIVSFDIKPAKNITGAMLFEHIDRMNDKDIEFNKVIRNIYTGQRGNFYTGLFLTIREHKLYCTRKREPGGVKLESHKIADGSSLFDFNMFLVDKTTLRGLYLQYHHSCSANQFCNFIKERHDKLKTKLKKQVVDAGKSEAVANKKYAGYFDWNIHVSELAFEDALAELEQIRSVGISLACVRPVSATGTPLDMLVKSERHEFSYTADFPAASQLVDLKAKWNALLGRDGVSTRQVTVRGSDEDNLERIVRLVSTPEAIEEYPHDDIAKDMNFPATAFNTSKVIDRMVALATKHQARVSYQVQP